MFTLGVMTDEVSQDFAHALDVIEEFGVRTLELHSIWDKNICDLDSHELTQVLRMVRRRGFAVCDIASLFLRCPIDDLDAYNEHVKILERSIQIAPLFDCELVRCFSFWREDDLEDPLGDHPRALGVAGAHGGVRGRDAGVRKRTLVQHRHRRGNYARLMEDRSIRRTCG